MNYINYQFIADAISFYEREGFYYVEVPWVVSRASIDATIPPGRSPYALANEGFLVGSAEQSFVEMMRTNKLLVPGRYVAASPCFRDDDIDDLHRRYFFKVELIELSRKPPSDDYSVHFMASLAQRLFIRLSGRRDIDLVKTADGHDLECNGIELGSYGQRSHDGWYWTYGTGIAEPRFSQATS